MRHVDRVFNFLCQEIMEYIFFQQIRQAFVNQNIPDKLASEILHQVSNKSIPMFMEIERYNPFNKRLGIYPPLRKALLGIAKLYETRNPNKIIIPHFDINMHLIGSEIQLNASLPAYNLRVTVPQQLNRDVHHRILNSAFHKMLLLITAIRYVREYQRHNKQMSLNTFWRDNTDIELLLETCRGKKYVILDV
jgi:hypothetical protein